jgi:hypothetical protein
MARNINGVNMPAISAQAKARLKANQKAYAESPRGKWSAQRAHARQRGIEFLLSFSEWYLVWENSGKYDQRGRASRQYCMARKGDVGAYAIGNVEIIPVVDNQKAQLVSGKRLPKEVITAIIAEVASGKTTAEVAKQFGISQPYVSRLTTGKRGKLTLSME